MQPLTSHSTREPHYQRLTGFSVWLLALWLCGAFVAISSPTALASDHEWQLHRVNGDISLYSRTVSGSEFIQTKAEVLLKTSLPALFVQFGDGSQCLKWQKRCMSSRVIKRVSDDELYAYSVVNLPWPLSNRDFVFHSLLTVDKDTNTTTLTFSPAKDMYPKTRYVRATANISYSVTAIDAGTNILTIIMHTEFAGKVAPGLINRMLVDELEQDVLNLMALLEAHKDAENDD